MKTALTNAKLSTTLAVVWVLGGCASAPVEEPSSWPTVIPESGPTVQIHPYELTFALSPEEAVKGVNPDYKGHSLDAELTGAMNRLSGHAVSKPVAVQENFGRKMIKEEERVSSGSAALPDTKATRDWMAYNSEMGGAAQYEKQSQHVLIATAPRPIPTYYSEKAEKAEAAKGDLLKTLEKKRLEAIDRAAQESTDGTVSEKQKFIDRAGLSDGSSALNLSGKKGDSNSSGESRSDSVVLKEYVVYFSFGSDDLKDEEKRVLDKAIGAVKAEVLKVASDPDKVDWRLVGHTDSVGSDTYNFKLGLSRASRVKGFLVQRGTPENHVFVQSKGESEPIAPNSNAEGRSKNRRVHIRIEELPSGVSISSIRQTDKKLAVPILLPSSSEGVDDLVLKRIEEAKRASSQGETQ